jgi:hypothetical protein
MAEDLGEVRVFAEMLRSKLVGVSQVAWFPTGEAFHIEGEGGRGRVINAIGLGSTELKRSYTKSFAKKPEPCCPSK